MIREVLPRTAVQPKRPAPVSPPRSPDESFQDRLRRVQELLIHQVTVDDLNDMLKVKVKIEQLVDEVLAKEGVRKAAAERVRLIEAISAEILGLGPIEVFMRDPTVTEIMVNAPDKVFIERHGKLELTKVRFTDHEHIKHIIDRIVAPLGRRCDESTPYVDARLKDGSRVHAIIPPVALRSPTLTIRKFSTDPLTIQDLVRRESLTANAAQFLRKCVGSRQNMIISGATGSGKTTLLNILSSFIPEGQRVVSCEDTAELQLRQVNWVALEARTANIEGRGSVSLRDLVKNTLRMRPDRVIIGECRGSEALDMIQAMNTGHDGSLTTLHANSPKDALGRLEMMCLMSGLDWPLSALRRQIASAVDLIIQQQRFPDGSRRVTYITEVLGLNGDEFLIQDLYRFEATRGDKFSGRIVGELRRTEAEPQFLQDDKYRMFLALNPEGAA